VFERAFAGLPAPLAAAVSLARRTEAVAAAFADLLIRVWLAQLFWMSGVAGLLDRQAAQLQAAGMARALAFHPPHAAALLTLAQLALPALLVVGLGVRLAALPLLVLSVGTYRADPAHDAPLLWALLTGWYAAVGAGPISVDHKLARGIYDSALPLARLAGRALAWVSRIGRPVALAVIRIGIAAVLLRHGMIAPGLAAALPFLLVIGLFARATTLPLLVVAGTSTMHAVSNEHLCWVSLLTLIAAMGPGALSLDFLLAKALRRGGRAMPVSYDAWTRDLPQIVIVGGGFAGIAAARGLRFQRCAVTLVDRQNYHLFQPLLYQVATASLSPADIATPIRTLFRDQHNIRVLLGRVVGIDADTKEVSLAGGARLRYDMLVLATGARHAYFGRDDWESYAPGLKTVENATEIRRRLLLAFEQAEAADDAAVRQALLTFAVIGGGPTGVELAGAIAELARRGMAREFRNIDPAQARVVLVQAGDRLLPTFPASLSSAAARSLAALGVEVRLGAAVDSVDEAGITLGSTHIACRTCFWAAGVAASPAGTWIGADCDRAGRLKVNKDLTVPGRNEIFAVGDTAAVDAWDGKPVPGLAPAAKQSGLYAARVIAARLNARGAPAPFRYRHAGSLATIGRRSAVADFGAVRIAGPLAWWLWGGVHILFLAGSRNRAVVAVQWFWAYLTFGRGIRLITGVPATTSEPSM
jgi:NADH dehydrogenase FAD-containing subunit/uncharacterized membrane protein YphA (DoxX/SURF4 family)